MSLVAIAKCSVVVALGATQFSVNYMTTKQEALVANQHLAKSDTLYHQGDIKGAVNEFYSAFSPTAEQDEVKVVAEYMDNLMVKNEMVKRGEDVVNQDHIHCMVFSVCKDGVKDDIQERAFQIRGEGIQGDEMVKRAPLPWIFHKTNQIARRAVMDLAHAFAVDYFGDYLRGSSPRSYGYNGAFLSWHHDMNRWSSATAQYYVSDVLVTSQNAGYISARVAAAYPTAAQFFCISNRPTGC